MIATAAVLKAFGEPLELGRLAVPPLSPGQMLVEVEAAGVCGSDVHMWLGKDPRISLPMILGHEGVGRIVEIHGRREDVYGQLLKQGQRILWERGVSCGRCYYCAVRKEPALCPHRWVYGIHRGIETPPHLNGCYATHIVLDSATLVVPLAQEVDPAIFVAVSCSGATAAHGFDQSPAEIGDTVVIFGPGPLGAFSVALARAQGASQIVIVGGTRQRLDICRQLGATITLNRNETTSQQRVQAVWDLTHGRGADLVVEAAGSIAASQEGLEMLRPGGTLSLVGFGAPSGQMTFAPFENIVRKNVRIQGVWVSDVRHTLRALDLVYQNPQLFSMLVTDRFPLAQATEALIRVRDRAAMKAVLLPQSS